MKLSIAADELNELNKLRPKDSRGTSKTFEVLKINFIMEEKMVERKKGEKFQQWLIDYHQKLFKEFIGH